MQALRHFLIELLGGKELREAEERISLAARAANDGLFDWDLITNRVHYSPRWKSALGYEDHEITDTLDEFDSRVHPDDVDEVRRVIADFIAGKSVWYPPEFRLRHKDGHFRWISARAVLVRNASGRPIRMAGAHTDITLRKIAERALQESEQRYRSLFEATFEAIVLHESGRIIDVNRAFEQMFDCNRVSAVGMDLLSLVAPEHVAALRRCLDRPDEEVVELEVRRTDGRCFPVEVHTKRVEYQGLPVSVLALRDISDRQRAEASERQRRQFAEALRDTVAAINSNLEIDALLDSILENAGRVVPYTCANIMFLSATEAQVVRLRGYENYVDPRIVQKERFSIAATANVRRVVETRAPLIINDTATDPDWVQLPHSEWLKAFLSVPICVDDRVIALLNLDSDHSNAFESRQVESLTLFAEAAGIALRNARLYEQARQEYRRTQALLHASRALSSTLTLDDLLSLLLDQAKQVLPFVSGSIAILDRGVLLMRAVFGYDSEQKSRLFTSQIELKDSLILKQIIATHEPMIIDDAQQDRRWIKRPVTSHIRAWMGLPLVVHGETLGVLSLDSDQVGTFTAEHMEIGLALAAQASAAIERSHLYEAERAARQRAQALLQANRVLSSTLSLDEVLDNILQQCARVLPYRTGSILAYDRGRASMAAVAGYSGSTADTVINLTTASLSESTILQQMARDLQPVLIGDVNLEPHWIALPGGEHIRAWIGVPLVVRGEMIGTLMLDSDQPNAYTEEDVDIARAFAEQAAIALHNAQLYEAEQRERAMAETLRQTSEALAGSIQLKATVELIVDLMSRIVEHSQALVVLLQGNRIQTLAARGYNSTEITDLDGSDVTTFPYAADLLQGKSALVTDTSKDTYWEQITKHRAPGAWLAMPLITKGEVTGVLTVTSHTPGAYTEREVQTLSAYANQAAIAIENGRLLLEVENSLAELQRAQEQLARSARLSAAGEVATGVAHQINNPLTVVMAETHLLLKRLPECSFERESAEAIREAAVQAGTVVQRMLDFTKQRSVSLGPVDLNRSLRNSVALLRAQLEPTSTLILQPALDIPPICGNEETLEEVWLNLLLNARDAIRGIPDGRITVSMQAAIHSVDVLINDNGCGIPEAILPQIFDPFFTTKEHGTGLGLSLSQDMIEKQGGSIHVHSVEGQGSTFVVRLRIFLEGALWDGQEGGCPSVY